MKIAFIGQKGVPAKQGGIEKHVYGLSKNLAQTGFDVYVYSRTHYTKSNRKKYGKINIINIPSINTKNLDAITHTIFSSIHSLFQNYDIIHYHGVGPSLMSWIPRVFSPKTKVVVTFHCIDRFHQKWSGFAKIMLTIGEWTACKFPHETIVTSKILEKYCQEKFNTECTHIPYAVETKHDKKNNDILKKYNLKKNGYFLSASRLVKHKGIHTLINAYQNIKTDKKLVIAGSSSNTNNYVSYIKILAKGNKNIIFVGEQTGLNLKTLFQNTYLFVQPSLTEGLSIALLEAISYGVPILVSDIPENLEGTNSIGMEFKQNDEKDLSLQLKRADKNPQLIRAQAKLMKKRLDQIHNWPDVTNKVIDLYTKTTNKNTLTNKRLVKTS